MDLIHHVTRGNRRFILINNPETDMRGFILELKRVTPTMIRGETLIEVVGADRFIADTVYIPEERKELYQDDNLALKFANGRIIKDGLLRDEETKQDCEICEKLRELEGLFDQ